MRRLRDGLIYAICLICIILLVQLQFQAGAEGDSALYGQYRQSFFAGLDDYCFHDDVEGEEGTQLDGAQLNALTIMVRHGDRTPMASDYLTNSLCDVSEFITQFVYHYGRCMDASVLDQLKPLTRSKLHCGQAQLTTRGLLQHQQNGVYFRNTYKDLFKDWRGAISTMRMVSTDYSRTILSLVSLLSALDAKWCQGNAITVTKELYFSTSTKPCPTLKSLHDLTPRISRHDWPKDLLKIKHLFAKTDREEDDWLALKNPDAIGDYVHGTYCHFGRLPLQCSKVTDSQCISFSEYDQFFELLKSLYRRRNEATTWHKHALLQTVHFLKATLSGKDDKNEEKRQINLFAGHDISIEAILLTLDQPLDHHVPFAARLVFEEWVESEGQKLISIYANGEPILINQRQFVPIEELDAFIDKKFEHLFKVPFTWENYETVCTHEFEVATVPN